MKHELPAHVLRFRLDPPNTKAGIGTTAKFGGLPMLYFQAGGLRTFTAIELFPQPHQVLRLSTSLRVIIMLMKEILQQPKSAAEKQPGVHSTTC